MGILYDLRQYHLHKAQTKFDNITNPPKWKVISHLRNTEFQVQFERTQYNGRFRTHANIVRGQKSFHGNNRGLIHKVVGLKYRVNGDIPSVTKTLDSFQPKTLGEKTLKKSAQAVNFIAHDVSQTVVDTALACEDISLKIGDTAVSETKNKLKQKYTREAVDDYHRGLFFMGRTSADAVKGTRQHFKLKKQHKLEKAKFKLKKAEFAVYHHDDFKPKLRRIKADFRLKKRKFQQTKREYQFELKKLKTTHKFRKKELNIQKSISKNSRLDLLVLKPVKYSAKRMTASAWQKALNEDSDNDFMRVADSAKRRFIEPTVQKVSRPERLQRSQKSRDKTADKKLKSQQKLYHQENRLKNQREQIRHRQKNHHHVSFSERLKTFFSSAKNVYTAEKLYAPFDCKIKQIDTDKNTIVLRKDDVTYWYDGTGGTKRDTEVYLTNVVLTDSLKVGDTIRTGEYFANVTNYQHCDNLENTGENYIHLKIKIDTDGFGWKFIDPRLVLY